MGYFDGIGRNPAQWIKETFDTPLGYGLEKDTGPQILHMLGTKGESSQGELPKHTQYLPSFKNLHLEMSRYKVVILNDVGKKLYEKEYDTDQADEFVQFSEDYFVASQREGVTLKSGLFQVVSTKNFCQDFFFPTTTHHLHRVEGLALRIIAGLGTLFLDLITLPIRLLTLIPCLRQKNKEAEIPLMKFLKEQQVANAKDLSHVRVYMFASNFGFDASKRLTKRQIILGREVDFKSTYAYEMKSDYINYKADEAEAGRQYWKNLGIKNPFSGDSFTTSNETEEARKYFDLKEGFTQRDLKDKFKEKALKHHPDKGGNAEEFRKAHKYYGVLLKS